MNLAMIFHHFTGVKLVWNLDFTIIWDHINNAELEGSDDLYYTTEYVQQYAQWNFIIANRHLLEYVPRYVFEYIPISYDKYRGTCRNMYSSTYLLVMV
jgi:hypothetical protein